MQISKLKSTTNPAYRFMCGMIFNFALCVLSFALLFIGCGLFHKEGSIVFVSGSYPVRPGWSKKDAWEVGGFMYFTGISSYRENKGTTKDEAIDAAVKFLLSYAGIKEERLIEMFRNDLTPKIITASKRKEKGPYEVTISDFYLEKYIIKKTKKLCYKGYVQLQFPLSKWIELRSYVRATLEQKYDEKFYER